MIESKRASISVEEGIPQILTYMMGNINDNKPTFWLITNGMYFLFLKLVKSDIYEYGLSDIFVMRNQNNQLYQVLQIMKKNSRIVNYCLWRSHSSETRFLLCKLSLFIINNPSETWFLTVKIRRDRPRETRFL